MRFLTLADDDRLDEAVSESLPVGRRVDETLKTFRGDLDYDLLDYYEFEEEIETFEPIIRKRR